MSTVKDPHEPVWAGFIEHLEKRNFKEAEKIHAFGWRNTQGLPLIDMRCTRFHALGDGETALDHFSRDKDHDVFDWLLEHGANWRSFARYAGQEPVSADVSVTLAIHGSVQNLKKLIDTVGPEPLESTASNVNMSLMHYACMHNHPAFVLALLDYNPGFLGVVDDIQRTPADLVTDDSEHDTVRDVLRSWRAQAAARQAIAESGISLSL